MILARGERARTRPRGTLVWIDGMPRFAAFLRGMNLGGRRITNEELVRSFTDLGFARVEAYQAAGNLVFEAPGRAQALATRLERGLRDALGYEVPTFLRTAAEVVALARAEPFAKRAVGSRSGKVQVALLRDAPNASAAKAARALETEEDWLELEATTLFWWPSRGVGAAELDVRALEKIVGPMTVRTQGTIARMAAKYFSHAASAS